MLNFGLTPEVQQSRRNSQRPRACLSHAGDEVSTTRPESACSWSKCVQSREPVDARRAVHDRLGLRELLLDWQLCERDWSTYRQTRELFIEAFEFRSEPVAGFPRIGRRQCARVEVLHSNHHLGTTRMARRKEDGVVDENCRCP